MHCAVSASWPDGVAEVCTRVGAIQGVYMGYTGCVLPYTAVIAVTGRILTLLAVIDVYGRY